MNKHPGMTLIEIVCVIIILSFAAMIALSMTGIQATKKSAPALRGSGAASAIGSAEDASSVFASLVNDDSVPRDEVLPRLLASLPPGTTGKWVSVSGGTLVDSAGPSDLLLVVTATDRAVPIRNLFAVSRVNPSDPKVDY